MEQKKMDEKTLETDPQEIAAHSTDELLCLDSHNKTIVTVTDIATLSTETADSLLSVAENLNTQPDDITAAVLSKLDASISTSTSTSISTSTATSISMLPSEPLPWRPNNRPKLPPGALLDIDQGPLWDIITEWLPFESVCHLDSALCQKSRRRRAEWLTMLSTKVLLFNREDIQVLKHSNQPDPFTHKALGAVALNWVLKRGVHLASLQLPRSKNITSECRRSISVAVPSLALDGRFDRLELVSFKWCTYIKNADLAAVLSKCYGTVKSINIEECGLTKSAAVHIKRCTKLEAFAPNGNESAADMAEIFQSCRKLRMIDLSAFYSGLIDDVVLSLADNCPLLDHLYLGEYSPVSDRAVGRVAESCPLLQFISLTSANITDTVVVSLCKHCTQLKRLFLGKCHNLTDANLIH